MVRTMMVQVNLPISYWGCCGRNLVTSNQLLELLLISVLDLGSDQDDLHK